MTKVHVLPNVRLALCYFGLAVVYILKLYHRSYVFLSMFSQEEEECQSNLQQKESLRPISCQMNGASYATKLGGFVDIL